MDAKNFYEVVAEVMGERILQVTGAAERLPWLPKERTSGSKKEERPALPAAAASEKIQAIHTAESEKEKNEIEGSCTSSCNGSAGQRSST